MLINLRNGGEYGSPRNDEVKPELPVRAPVSLEGPEPAPKWRNYFMGRARLRVLANEGHHPYFPGQPVQQFHGREAST